MQRVEEKVDGLERKVDLIDRKVDSLAREIPRMVAVTMRDVMREERERK